MLLSPRHWCGSTLLKGATVSQGSTLRDQQAEFTKRLLLDAAKKVLIENDADDFTMQKVAEEAGVSHRTVYRYFPSRQALIDEFSEFLESQFGRSRIAIDDIRRVDELAESVFAMFDTNAAYYEAAARLNSGYLRPANQAERTAQFRRLFDARFGDLDPAAADKAFAIIRYLVGLQTWFSLRDRFGFQDGETGDAVAWAARELVRALEEGRAPRSSSKAESDNAEN
jgi:AcrR family transcriptional regulator